MASYHRRKLDEYSTKTTDTCYQMQEYLTKPHGINPAYLTWIYDNITTIKILERMALLECTANIVDKLKSSLNLEKRGINQKAI